MSRFTRHAGPDPDRLTQEAHSATSRVITYSRDPNGFLVHKFTAEASEDDADEDYSPNALGRLASLTKTVGAGSPSTSTYRYDTSAELASVSAAGNSVSYLLDSYNPTGCSQRLASRYGAGGSETRIFGDDLLAESRPGALQHLLYDGQGTTRQLADNSGIAQSYFLDAYGTERAKNSSLATPPLTAATSYLYTGEVRDAATGWTYLRARFLDTSTGTFNRSDPFFGNLDNPQSLHKYAYVHQDPVNAWDPNGNEITLANQVATNGLISFLILFGFKAAKISRNSDQSIRSQVLWAIVEALVDAVIAVVAGPLLSKYGSQVANRIFEVIKKIIPKSAKLVEWIMQIAVNKYWGPVLFNFIRALIVTIYVAINEYVHDKPVNSNVLLAVFIVTFFVGLLESFLFSDQHLEDYAGAARGIFWQDPEPHRRRMGRVFYNRITGRCGYFVFPSSRGKLSEVL